MSLPYADSTFPYGSKSLTIATVAFVATNIRPTDNTVQIRRKNELGVPSGNRIIQDFVEGTATLQLATTTTIPPANGATFDCDLFVAGGTAPTWIITSVSPAYEHVSETVVDISFVKKVS